MSNVIYKQGQISDIDENLGIVKGYGSVFGNKDSDNDIIEKGAYRRTIKNNGSRVKYLYQHDITKPIGKMKELYGDKAQEVMLQKASSSNISVDFLKDIAAKSPNAFYNVLGLSTQKPTTPTLTTGTVDTSGTQTNTSSGNTWADFEKMRKENPKLYWKPETQMRILKEKQEQGESFGNN